MLKAGESVLATRQEHSSHTDNTDASTGETSLDGKIRWLRLPTEVWELIASFLCPMIGPGPKTGPVWDSQPSKVTTYDQDILALASTCRQLKGTVLPALYNSIFLDHEESVNAFIKSICRNDGESLLPAKSDTANWVRSLHITGNVICHDVTFGPRTFCACDLHILFSFASRIRYLSIETTDERGCEDTYGGSEGFLNHPFIHFLSTTTKCRPRALTWSYRYSSTCLSLRNVTSYAPLSQLTHLEISNIDAPLQLYAFLAGDLSSAQNDHMVKDAIASGLSPHSLLKRLQLSHLSAHVLCLLTEYFSELHEVTRIRPGGANPRASRFVDGHRHHRLLGTLCLLAKNACNLPSLKLLVLGIDRYHGGGLYTSDDLRKLLVDRGVLKDALNPNTLRHGIGTFATRLLSSSFKTTLQNSDPDTMLLADCTRLTVQEAPESWRNTLASEDEFWRKIQAAKQKLLDVWNGNRAEKGQHPTEIRVVASGDITDRLEHLKISQEDFFHQAQLNSMNQDLPGSDKAEKFTSRKWEWWRDQDVFSLVETMPWLSYYRLDNDDCCFWTAELPRDNDPNSFFTSSGSDAARVILPPLVKIETEKPKTREAKKTRKRQRTNSSSTQQEGPSRS